MGCKSCDIPKPKYRKGLWSPEEDNRLRTYVMKHGHGCWSAVPGKAGLQRNGKSCRLRWINYLRPGLKRGVFTIEEEETILNLHGLLGNKWSQIATQLPGRTDNEIKNHWNSYLKKRTIKLGFEPETSSNSPFLNTTPTMESPPPQQSNRQISKFEYPETLEALTESDHTSPTDSNSVPHLFEPYPGAENQKSQLPKLLFTEWLTNDHGAGRNFMDSGVLTFADGSFNNSNSQEVFKQEFFNVEEPTGGVVYEFGSSHGDEFQPQFKPESGFPAGGFYDLHSLGDFSSDFMMTQDVIY